MQAKPKGPDVVAGMEYRFEFSKRLFNGGKYLPMGSRAGRRALNNLSASRLTTFNTHYSSIFSRIRSPVFALYHDCVTGSNGVMYEADLIRNCGAGNAACAGAGAHDVLVFAIGIGEDNDTLSRMRASINTPSACFCAHSQRTDLLNTGNNTIESINTVCTPPPPTYGDNDTYADLLNGWPCGTGPCINTTQEKGKVYIVDTKRQCASPNAAGLRRDRGDFETSPHALTAAWMPTRNAILARMTNAPDIFCAAPGVVETFDDDL